MGAGQIGKRILLFVASAAIPLYTFADPYMRVSDVRVSATLISIANFILLITSIICMIQYFWPREESYTDHTTFHIVHFFSVILFYIIAVWFLIEHKSYYPQYDYLNDHTVVKKLFFGLNWYSIKQWIILLSLVINVLYVSKSVSYNV